MRMISLIHRVIVLPDFQSVRVGLVVSTGSSMPDA
jgi:hypothetical protein